MRIQSDTTLKKPVSNTNKNMTSLVSKSSSPAICPRFKDPNKVLPMPVSESITFYQRPEDLLSGVLKADEREMEFIQQPEILGGTTQWISFVGYSSMIETEKGKRRKETRWITNSTSGRKIDSGRHAMIECIRQLYFCDFKAHKEFLDSYLANMSKDVTGGPLGRVPKLIDKASSGDRDSTDISNQSGVQGKESLKQINQYQGAVSELSRCSAFAEQGLFISDASILHVQCRDRIHNYVNQRLGCGSNDFVETKQPVLRDEEGHNVFEARIPLFLPKSIFGDRFALGIGAKKKDAVSAAFQHAELMLDALGVPIFVVHERYHEIGSGYQEKSTLATSLQDERARETRKTGRWAPYSYDEIRPWAKVPPPCRIKPGAMTEGMDMSCYDSLKELGPDRSHDVHTILDKLNISYRRRTETITLKKEFMFRTTLVLHFSGESREAQGIAKTKNASIHVAFVHAYRILDACGANLRRFNPRIDSPPPLIYLDIIVTSKQAHVPIDLTSKERIDERKIFEPDTSCGFILVREHDVQTTNVISCAISSPRKVDIYCATRMREFYKTMSRNLSMDLPIQIDEYVDGGRLLRKGRFELQLPDPFPPIIASAEASSKKEIVHLVSMSLELHLDAVGYPIYKDPRLQYEHAEAARRGGRNAPYPPRDGIYKPVPNPSQIPPLRKDTDDKSLQELSLAVSQGNLEAACIPVTTGSDSSFNTNDLSLENVPTSHLHTRARSYRAPVEAYLCRIGRNLSLKTVQKNGNFYSRCKVYLPDTIPTQLAIGVSRMECEAEQLCFLHFSRVLDAFNVCIYDNPSSQGEHVAYVMEEGRTAPKFGDQPNPDSLPPPGLAASVLLRPAKPAFPSCLDGGHANWEKYCSLCATYLNDRRSYEDTLSVAKQDLYHSGDAILEEARVASEKEPLDTHAKTVLYNFCLRVGLPAPEYTSKMTTTSGMFVFSATVKLKGFDWIASSRIMPGKENAQRRAAMHCLEVLKRTHPEFDPERDYSRRIRQRFSGQFESLSAWMGSAMTSLGYQRLAEMYTVCNDIAPPRMSTKYTGNSTHATLTVEEDGTVYEGVGEYGNRVVAEDMAKEALCLNMKGLPKFAGLVGLFKQFPRLDPDHVFHLNMTNTTFLDSLSQLVDEVQQLPEMSDPELPRGSTASNAPKAIVSKRRVSEEIIKKRKHLPMFRYYRHIVDTIKDNQVTVLCGTTGSGKSTQLPQYILEEAFRQGTEEETNIVVTQPRRISAISIAQRVAQERGEEVGQSVGHCVRFESRPGKHITYYSSGILLRIFERNPVLDGISHVILDEVHERDLNADFLLLVLRRLSRFRKDLKIVIMSATLQSDRFSKYFEGAPVINVDHAVHPVQIFHLEEIAQMTMDEPQAKNISTLRVLRSASQTQTSSAITRQEPKKDLDRKLKLRSMDYNFISFLIQRGAKTHHLFESGGSILVFLPGWHEIVHAKDMLEASGKAVNFEIICVHSSVNPQEQMKCFLPAPRNKVKVILATNIAESGITIDDVVCVIDTGAVKEKRLVKQTDGQRASQLSTLTTVYASKANCIQRKGRAGRTKEGYCYRLYTSQEYSQLDDFQTPEILRLPLQALCLSILHLGLGAPARVLGTALDAPDKDSIEQAMNSLMSIGAVDSEGHITRLGKHIARLPTTPSNAKMLLMGCALRGLDVALTLVASSETNPFKTSQDQGVDDIRIARDILGENEKSDHFVLLNAYRGYAEKWADKEKRRIFLSENSLYEPSLKIMSQIKRQLMEELVISGYVDESLLVEKSSSENSRNGADNSQNHEAPFPIQKRRGQLRRLIGQGEEPYVDCSEYSQNVSGTTFHALLSSMLFPNVAMGGAKNHYRTKVSDTLRLKHGSLCATTKGETSTFVLYSEKVAKNAVLRDGTRCVGELRDVTEVSLWPLVLCGASSLHFKYREDLNLCVVDDWIVVKMDVDTFRNIKKIKLGLEYCMDMDPRIPPDTLNRLARQVRRVLQYVCAVMPPTLAKKSLLCVSNAPTKPSALKLSVVDGNDECS